MKIFFVRHGETEWNALGLIQGQADIPLNSNGRKQAHFLGKQLSNVHFDYIISSPLSRAIETAEIICKNNREIYIDDLLKEISYGICEGQNLKEIHKETCCELHSFFSDPKYYQPPEGGESIPELKERARIFLQKLISERNDDKNILVSTHGAYIRGVISVINQLSDAEFWMGKEQENCSVTIVDYTGQRFSVEAEALSPEILLKQMRAAHSPMAM